MSCAAPLSLPPAPAHARFADWNFSSLLEVFRGQQRFRRNRRLPHVGDHLVLSGSGEHVWVTSAVPFARAFTVDFRDGATSAESLRVGHDEWVAPGEGAQRGPAGPPAGRSKGEGAATVVRVKTVAGSIPSPVRVLAG